MTADAPRLTPIDALLGADHDGVAAPYPGVAAALAARVRADGASPMVTFYDDATGERVELSGITMDNWVAKTANLLVDTLGLAPGDRVAIDLPAHWLTVVILLAAWSAGMDVLVATGGDEKDSDELADELADDEADGDVRAVFAAEARVGAALALGADEVVALSLRPLGARMAHPVAGVLDFAAEVPAHGDRFTAPRPPAGQAALMARAATAAAAGGVTSADRLLATGGPASAEGLLGAVLVPLVSGASVVLCRNLDTAALARRVAMEKVTAVCGVEGEPPAGVRCVRF
jgi:uncharacterized protein (TIGR03089 family)